MPVYIVMRCLYEGEKVIGVFSTEEKANKYIDDLENSKYYDYFVRREIIDYV